MASAEKTNGVVHDELLDPVAVAEAAKRMGFKPELILKSPKVIVQHLVYALISTEPRVESVKKRAKGRNRPIGLKRIVQNAYPREALRPKLYPVREDLRRELQDWQPEGTQLRSIMLNPNWNVAAVKEHVQRWAEQVPKSRVRRMNAEDPAASTISS